MPFLLPEWSIELYCWSIWGTQSV